MLGTRLAPLPLHGILQMLGLLQYGNYRDKFLFRTGIIVNAKGGKVSPKLPFLLAALIICGALQLPCHIRSGGFLVCRGFVFHMGRANVIQNGSQIFCYNSLEIVPGLHLCQLQCPHIQVIGIWGILPLYLFSRNFQHGVQIANSGIRYAIHIYLRIHHQPPELLMANQLRQKTVIKFPVFQYGQCIITQMQGDQLCV